jgi:protein-S-isoprenylcysteine O-methyltransferase Ste14
VLIRALVWGGGMVFVASLTGFAYALFAPGGTLSVFAGPWNAAGWRPILADAAMFTGFALHHSAFARLGVKRWLTRHLPAALERSTYVWISSVLFAAVYLAWQPVPGRAWHVTGALGLALALAPLSGVVVTLHAARRLDVLELAGVRQAAPVRADAPLVDSGLYGFVRHPIYLGWLLLVWPAADMTGTHLTFAAVSTVYLAVAIPLEERGLRRTFGDAYDAYRRRVRWRMLPFVY